MHAPSSLPAVARRYARRVGTWLQAWPRSAPELRRGARHATADASVAFRCNLCGRANRVAPAAIGREVPSCARCGSTVRLRAIGRLVTRELLGREAILPELAPDKRVRGLGLSDAKPCAVALARRFGYENTFLHAKPRMDILDVPAERRGHYHFVIASDVFEHVVQPVERAFENARALLAPGGVLIFTAPFTLESRTVEHYPELYDWRVVESDGRWRVLNTTRAGRTQVFDDPVFHGGPGATLEMRVFSRDALLRHFAEAGFARARIADEGCAAYGIAWPEPWSAPMVAYA